MGDDKQYTIQVKGTAYRFKQLPVSDPKAPIDVERVTMVMHMGVSSSKTIKALMRLLAESAGPDQWDAITDRYMAGELAVDEFTTKLFQKLMAKQSKDGESTADDE